MESCWKVLFIGLAAHAALVNYLRDAGHDADVADTLVEGCLCAAASDYDVIIIDAEVNTDEVEVLCEWLVDRAPNAQVIRLTRWRGTKHFALTGDCFRIPA